jgi:hypothetical protein
VALATFAPGGELKTLNDKCKITITGHTINLRILPEISDTKKATYADQTIIGRSFPIKTYSHSDNRVITMKLHFLVVKKSDIQKNIDDLRAIESATYPRKGDPYLPPPVCKINCGKMLGEQALCVVLENYNVSFPTNVAWDKDTLCPYYFQVSTTWHVVYSSSSLPNQDKIMMAGR